jgi:hypothetical protein
LFRVFELFKEPTDRSLADRFGLAFDHDYSVSLALYQIKVKGEKVSLHRDLQHRSCPNRSMNVSGVQVSLNRFPTLFTTIGSPLAQRRSKRELLNSSASTNMKACDFSPSPAGSSSGEMAGFVDFE